MFGCITNLSCVATGTSFPVGPIVCILLTTSSDFFACELNSNENAFE